MVILHDVVKTIQNLGIFFHLSKKDKRKT